MRPAVVSRFVRRVKKQLRRRTPDRASRKRILVCWNTDPRYIAPFRLSDGQVTIGPQVRPDQTLPPFDGFAPSGRFDLLSVLESLHLPTEYDAIIVRTHFDGSNQPLNLGAFDCPKVLCVADIHQQNAPIRNLVDYAQRARFNFILCSFTRQHAHWFIESGFDNVAWIPGLVQNISRPLSADRRKQLCFFGTVGKRHPRRTHLLTELRSREPFPLLARKGRQEAGADLYAASTVSLNCSLNGDLNLRVFEILAAGGCLLTDRLAPQAGLDLLLKEGRDFLGFDSVEECIEQAQYLIGHDEIAFGIAKSGYELFNAQMRPEQRARQLLDWIFHGRLNSLFRVNDFPRHWNGHHPALLNRIQLYEALQELHRTQLSPSVLFMHDVPDVQVLDALDLRHLRITLAGERRNDVFDSPEMRERFRRISREEWSKESWDCVVTADGKLPRASTAC